MWLEPFKSSFMVSVSIQQLSRNTLIKCRMLSVSRKIWCLYDNCAKPQNQKQIIFGIIHSIFWLISGYNIHLETTVRISRSTYVSQSSKWVAFKECISECIQRSNQYWITTYQSCNSTNAILWLFDFLPCFNKKSVKKIWVIAFLYWIWKNLIPSSFKSFWQLKRKYQSQHRSTRKTTS